MGPFFTSSRTRPASAALVALTVALVTLLQGSVAAGTTFNFYGSGYGHGLGMSQYGSLGLARRGWSHERILRYYYRGTSVGPAPSVPGRLRVGLLQDRGRIRLTGRNGRVELRVGNPDTGTLAGRIPADVTWTVEPNASGRYRILNARGRLVGGHAWGGRDQHLYARYANSGARVFLEQAGHTYNRGSIEFNSYRTCPTCAHVLRVVIRLTHTAYLFGIGEVPSSWPMRALRAQAVASLTYALDRWSRVGLRTACNCHVYASVLDQVYIGWDKESGELGGRWVEAVRDIGRNVVLLDGQPIQAFFHSSSGGYSADNRDVFGAPLSYLEAGCDIGDNTPTNPNSVWTVPLTDSSVTSRLRSYTGNIGTVTGFSGPVRDVSGRMTTVTVNGTGGSATLTGSTLRSALRLGLGLKSTRVWIDANRHVTGPIRAKYDGLRCAPGLPTSAQLVAGTGHRQSFAVGRIYHKDTAGAHWLHGSVLAYYLGQGGAGGRLGFPLSDVRTGPGGETSATFEGGTVTCSSEGVCSG
jgi:stage II sporulation protein D